MTVDPGIERLMLERGWLSHLPIHQAQSVLHKSVVRVAQANEVLFRLGDASSGMYGLIDGALYVSLDPGERGPYPAGFIPRGGWIGETAMLMSRPRGVSASVPIASRLLHLPTDAIEELLATDPAFWRCIGVNAALHLAVMYRRLNDMVMQRPESSIASILLHLAGFDLDYDRDWAAFAQSSGTVHLGHKELAWISGYSRAGLSRILKDFTNLGLIETSYRKIVLLDPRRLSGIAGEPERSIGSLSTAQPGASAPRRRPGVHSTGATPPLP